ncbi:MAG TPA: hypothetical protein VIM61_04545 [Chthoniobacterales bacterium]
MKPRTAPIFKAVEGFCPISLRSAFVAGVLALGFVAPLHADYLDEIGYRDLVAELQAAGKTVPDGTGVTVSQVEASLGTDTSVTPNTYAYLADQSLFTGVTITNASGSSYPAAISSHANEVGFHLFGDASMGSGITAVTAYLADHWVGSGSLNFTTTGFSPLAPLTEGRDVANFSWVGTTGSAANDQLILNRLDYQIQRDDYVAVVAVNNGSVAQNLLASAYNVISVGVTSGNHASGSSSEVNSAVTYPQLVVPESATSYATPVVSSAAALLVQTARGSSTTSANGTKSEVVKAILLAGATKSEFTTWSRSDTSPLDATFGAGELNVQNSSHILTAGEQTANAVVATTGWDFNSIALNATVSYTFDLAATGDLSVALTWNAIYSEVNFNALSLSLADLNLSLYEIGTGGALTLVQQSLSSGNIEALWVTDLAAGDYVLKVTYASNASGFGSTAEYAVAWQTTYTGFVAVPEPAFTALIVAGGLVMVVTLRRRVARSL